MSIFGYLYLCIFANTFAPMTGRLPCVILANTLTDDDLIDEEADDDVDVEAEGVDHTSTLMALKRVEYTGMWVK